MMSCVLSADGWIASGKALPFVSGIQIQKNAASKKAIAPAANAAPKPCLCAREPTVNGAAALTILPAL